jgi:hypothetical protein
VGGVKKCFLGLRQTALLSAEGKNGTLKYHQETPEKNFERIYAFREIQRERGRKQKREREIEKKKERGREREGERKRARAKEIKREKRERE